jgi:hypothetical protein
MTQTEPEQERWLPQTDEERAQVMEQLQRLLVSNGFQNSKRYPGLLRYVVEQSLAGNEEQLKERLLGVQVFGRAADYDTNQDPVVRLSASEVRKRLTAYYQQPQHERELVIGLSSGSYIPYFQRSSGDGLNLEEALTASEERGWLRIRRRRALLWAAIGLAFGIALLLCWGLAEVEDPARNFWAPVLRSPNRVTLCAGSPSSFIHAQMLGMVAAEPGLPSGVPVHPAPSSLDPSRGAKPLAGSEAQKDELITSIYQILDQNGSLSLSHANALVHIGAYLDNHNKAFRVQLDSQSDFTELREGPVVLIGAGDNAWTMRLSAALRYGFGYQVNDKSRRVVDHRNPSATNWSIALDPQHNAMTRDYGLVARYHDTVLDQPVVMVAGLSSVGTEAASQFIGRPDALRELFRAAPRSAEHVNVEAVLETQVIDGHAGPTRIVAIEYW